MKYGDFQNLTAKDVLLIKRNIHNAWVSKLLKLLTTLSEVHETFKDMEFKTNKSMTF